MNLNTLSQSRPHEAAPPPPVDIRENRDSREYRDSSRDSTLRETKDSREIRESRERDSNTREKRNSKPEVPVVPLVDHRSGDDKQRPRSSQEPKHPRSAALSSVILPLLSEVCFNLRDFFVSLFIYIFFIFHFINFIIFVTASTQV